MKSFTFSVLFFFVTFACINTAQAQICGVVFENPEPIPDDQSQSFTQQALVEALPGLQITSADDIVHFFVNMEHSYLGDLVIRFICPNGQIMTLHNQGGGGAYMGVPVDNNALPFSAGVGYDYWWAPNAPFGTLVQESQAVSSLPSGIYSATGSWTSLIGCPVQGSWTLEIMDLWMSDNGFLFSWGIGFSNTLEANCPTITVGCMEPTACNYNPEATTPGDCFLPSCGDMMACNYNPDALCFEEALCLYPTCWEPTACNYDPSGVCVDYDLCVYPDCDDPLACNYNPNAPCGGGWCQYPGCLDPDACNYSVFAFCDDGSCVYPGCTDPNACNYNPDAGCSGGFCDYYSCIEISYELVIDHQCDSVFMTLSILDFYPPWISQFMLSGWGNVLEIPADEIINQEISFVSSGGGVDEIMIISGIPTQTGTTYFSSMQIATVESFANPFWFGITSPNGVLYTADADPDWIWFWYMNGILVSQNQFYQPLENGVLKLCVSPDATLLCEYCTQKNVTVGLEEVGEEFLFEILNNGGPRPTLIQNQNEEIQVFDVLGNLVKILNLQKGESYVFDFASGLYLLFSQGQKGKLVVE